MGYWLIDPPGTFAPIEEIRRFLRSMDRQIADSETLSEDRAQFQECRDQLLADIRYFNERFRAAGRLDLVRDLGN